MTDVHEADLEELLIYDDLFLEYFNAFVALPAFPVRIFYDRLTGHVRDLDGTLQDGPQEFGAGDLQRETTLLWLQQERLLLFRRSPLYLEYKLAKLLVRPLEDPQPASRYDIRGYSRQIDSAALSTALCSAVPHQFRTPSIWPEEPPPIEGRFPSRVHSTPAAPGYESDTYRLSLLAQYGDAIMRLCHPSDPQMEDGDLYVAFTHSQTIGLGCPESPSIRLRTEAPAWAEYQRDTRDPGSAARSNEEQGMGWADHEDHEDLYSITEEEENFVKQHNLTMYDLQQLKEEALSSRAGIGRFMRFLQDTKGSHILHFWMDCEAFKEQSVDLEVNHSPEDARHLCVHLFRSIQNKYQIYLRPESQEQIRLCQQSRGPSYHALRRSQYDALRRLRSYWIPRFLIHWQREHPLRRTEHKGVKPDAPSLEVAIHTSPFMDPVEGDASTPLGNKDNDTIFRYPDDPQIPGSSLPDRMIPALKNDATAGGTFLHYLNRFELPKTTQIFLLWQELSDYGEWGAERNQSGASQRQVWGRSPDVYPESSITHAGEPAVGHSDASSGQIHLEDLGSAYHLALDALRDSWIRFLNYDISMFLKYCVPPSHHKSKKSGSSASKGVKTRQKRSHKENGHGGLHHGGSKKASKRRDPFTVPSQITGCPSHLLHDPNIPLEMLQHRAVYKAYKKLVQETEMPQALRVLEMLHALQSKKGEAKMLGLIQKVLELDAIQNPQLQGLRKHLTNELSKGMVSSSSITQVTRFLGGLLAASFNKFWVEMLGRLKDYGVEQSGNEGWARLEPILLVLSTKMAMKRLHGRRNDVYHPAQLQPSVDDGDTFHQALEMAAKGWPTPEVLHFLKYLQIHGPQEGLPLLENNLLCCLELMKYKNAHHAMPDHGLLKRKVHVIKERFLFLHGNPVLQLSPELLEAALRDAEVAAHSDLPAISLFDHLHDWLTNSLLPFWAGFRKAWAVRSPSSAQRVPQLRVQQMLRKRLAKFEVEETPLKTFQLPPVQHNPQKAGSSMVTFSFSMTAGLTLKENTAQTPDHPASRRPSQPGLLPSISPTFPETAQPDVIAADDE
ncbi:uncharacterized protein LOC120999805 isoform X2 [Bufo bufo]|uniref:uncharacterized protein LOC120999805 isoform X2 n=1 Tax=Bufo bufo TaxID=8384 RepID=UPI001ABE765D|nr:uncharacterized protein LOC120999805 isoform X2 [Bufo bufo]